MQLSFQLKSDLSNATMWLEKHPAVLRVALLALPLAVALITALVGGDVAYACPLGGGGSGCGD